MCVLAVARLCPVCLRRKHLFRQGLTMLWGNLALTAAPFPTPAKGSFLKGGTFSSTLSRLAPTLRQFKVFSAMPSVKIRVGQANARVVNPIKFFVLATSPTIQFRFVPYFAVACFHFHQSKVNIGRNAMRATIGLGMVARSHVSNPCFQVG